MEEGVPFPDPSPELMLDFKLNVKCRWNKKAAAKGTEDPKELYINSNGRSVPCNTSIEIVFMSMLGCVQLLQKVWSGYLLEIKRKRSTHAHPSPPPLTHKHTHVSNLPPLPSSAG